MGSDSLHKKNHVDERGFETHLDRLRRIQDEKRELLDEAHRVMIDFQCAYAWEQLAQKRAYGAWRRDKKWFEETKKTLDRRSKGVDEESVWRKFYELSPDNLVDLTKRDLKYLHAYFAHDSARTKLACAEFHLELTQFRRDELGAPLRQSTRLWHRCQTEYKEAKKDFFDALDATCKRRYRWLEKVSDIAEAAGVPAEYLDNVRVREVFLSGGQDCAYPGYNIYFGGIDGDPSGPGHGHYRVAIIKGEVILTYKREPNGPRGPQNFTKIKLSPKEE